MGNIFRKEVLYNTNEEYEEIFVDDEALAFPVDEEAFVTPVRYINNERENTTSYNFDDSSEVPVKLSVAEKLSNADQSIAELLSRWKSEQILLKEKLQVENDDELVNGLRELSNGNDISTPAIYIAGVDISFPSDKTDLVHACACVVVLSYPQLEIVYKQCKIVHLTSVYIPEYLAFREVEPLQNLLNDLRQVHPEYYPQLILVDGNGMLHPRHFGLACQLGVVLDIPTIGVAKKLFQVDGLEKNDSFKTKVKTLLNRKGANFDLIGDSGFVLGKALRSTESSSNPIFVSIGHKVCLQTAVELVSNCCMVRVPEPIRWADILSREFIRNEYDDHVKRCSDYIELNKYFKKISELAK